jgi:sulfite reductase (ferredoxin)
MRYGNPGKRRPHRASRYAKYDRDSDAGTGQRNRLLPAAREGVMALARDVGDRTDRKRARLKSVIDDMGLAWVQDRLPERFGRRMDAPPPLPCFLGLDHLGWHHQGDGRWWLGLPVPSGQIDDAGSTGCARSSRDSISPPSSAVAGRAARGRRRGEFEGTEAAPHGFGVAVAEDASPVSRWSLAYAEAAANHRLASGRDAAPRAFGRGAEG